jgi:hypothetical protein
MSASDSQLENGFTKSTRPTDQTPLLREYSASDASSVSNESDGSGVPLVEEKSTAALLLILGGVWLGVFLAALGTYSSEILRIGCFY